MNRNILFLLLGLIFVASGCAHEPMIAKGSMFESSINSAYMILPFGDLNSPKYRYNYQNAALVVRDAFETAFLEQGFKIIRCPDALSSDAVRGVKKTVTANLSNEEMENESTTSTKKNLEVESQSSLGIQGITEGQAIEAGKEGGADIVLMGVVTTFYRGVFLAGDNYTTVGFSVKAIDVKTGEIAWKASISRQTQWDFDYDPSMYAQDLARELAKELVGK